MSGKFGRTRTLDLDFRSSNQGARRPLLRRSLRRADALLAARARLSRAGARPHRGARRERISSARRSGGDNLLASPRARTRCACCAPCCAARRGACATPSDRAAALRGPAATIAACYRAPAATGLSVLGACTSQDAVATHASLAQRAGGGPWGAARRTLSAHGVATSKGSHTHTHTHTQTNRQRTPPPLRAKPLRPLSLVRGAAGIVIEFEVQRVAGLACVVKLVGAPRRRPRRDRRG